MTQHVTLFNIMDFPESHGTYESWVQCTRCICHIIGTDMLKQRREGVRRRWPAWAPAVTLWVSAARPVLLLRRDLWASGVAGVSKEHLVVLMTKVQTLSMPASWWPSWFCNTSLLYCFFCCSLEAALSHRWSLRVIHESLYHLQKHTSPIRNGPWSNSDCLTVFIGKAVFGNLYPIQWILWAIYCKN